MNVDYYEKYGLKEVINASGKMTILGVSKYSDEIIEAQKFGGQHFFEMEQLSKKTGEYVAQLIGVEAAHIVSSASAGIAQSVAGIIGQGSMFHLYHPYSEKISKREIIIPKGHNVDYGTPVEVMIAVGGGEMVEAGYANMCNPAHLEEMITDQTAAILYIKSHHTVQKSMLTVEEAAEVAHKNHVPLIVDAAAEEDLAKYISSGADLVIYSGAKALEGTSSGVVIGKTQFIEWVSLQSKGIGRAMKIGKENILGLATAIEKYLRDGSESGEHMKERLEPWIERLNEVSGISASIVQDGAGREIYRAKVQIDERASMNAKQIIEKLKTGNPAVYTREYQANNGIIEFDIRAVNQNEMKQIWHRLKEIMD
ncbi:DgaE family pyridoxal phosphate-dependent ammonia lyase [Desemzia sp. RIT804]|uniref:DgaE family pyridoxal phosphate-dependent ammonia lyase n=1 Tax=Desemzia sp. RIT 804 TaxID=2810209 RepID=UPI0019501C5C|nr:DgaE family pyridoxal phosphate-dependent ammonia lyase [Desemzia sp. RIT 804]MBM6615288.1 DgaE family pyridoxal phosphate-dependent ammonia lyase [Desemzia sp. RIT 804]